MENVKVPAGYQRVMPYLILTDAVDFLHFVKRVFKAEEKLKIMRDETHIMHAEITIGDSVIMFADSTERYLPQTAGLFIYVDNADEIQKKAIDEGAVEIMALSDESYGRACGVTDPFGNIWWITSVLPEKQES